MARFEIFNCYSHSDDELRLDLDKHLSSLKREGRISNWCDRKIGPGKDWEGQIDEHINTAHIILLLVSSDFLSSEYCYDIEMKRALERHQAGEAIVIPVILRPVDWEKCPFGKLQALPTNAEPITRCSNRDEGFLDVAKGIRSICEEIERKDIDQANIISPPGSNLSSGRYLEDEMSIILTDDFEQQHNWQQYLEGEVSQSDEFAHSGKYSLKKGKNNDPHGGYRRFDVPISGGFIFTGWLYRPSEGMRGVAERLALEDDRGCGYGFCVSHKINEVVIFSMELRENGICTENISYLFALRNDPLRNVWYYFYMQLTQNGILHFSLDVSGNRLRGISVKDSRYSEFTRMTVHGGHPYYIDDVQIIGNPKTT